MHTESPNALTEYQLEPVAERFFGRSVDDSVGVGVDDTRRPELPHGSKRAMRATFAMLGVFSLALVAFLIYARVIMPVPAELGGDYGFSLPEPAASSAQ
jgi:hypothetical protein